MEFGVGGKSGAQNGHGKTFGVRERCYHDSEIASERRVRYARFFEQEQETFTEGISEPMTDWRESYVKAFTDWMNQCFGCEFDDLANVQALRALIRYPADESVPTHYPLKPKQNSKNYEWLMYNRKPERIRNSQAQILPLVVQVEGMPDTLKRAVE